MSKDASSKVTLTFMVDKVYPHRLFDHDVYAIRKIIDDTFSFTLGFLEKHLPELVAEIEDRAGGVIISERTIKDAVAEVDKFQEALHQGFDYKIDSRRWRQGEYRAKKYYLKVLNEPLSLVFAQEVEEKIVVISKPLFHAIAEACVGIFDYSISKSPQMKYVLSKSNDTDRQKILKITDRRQLKYYFIRILVSYGATDQQLIRNLDTVFGKNQSKAKLSTGKLPTLFR